MHTIIGALLCLLVAAIAAGAIGFEERLRLVALGFIARRLNLREDRLSTRPITIALNILGIAAYLGLLSAALWTLAERSG